ncbi:MAG: hypothetical protein ACRELT_08425 [Longimicrobiales bacterium]
MQVNRRNLECLGGLLIIAAGLTACEPASVSPFEADHAGAEAAAISADHSTTPVLTFAGMADVGTSSLVRRSDGVSFNVRTTQLEPGTATTVWVVVFNRPQACAGTPCMEPDLFNPDTEADVMYGAGHVIGGAGRATFAGSRRVGDASGSIFAPLGLPAPGLQDAQSAEIHLVVRSHGPTIPGLVSDMIHSFNGGCQPLGPPFPAPLPPEYGVPGPNTCVDVQFAIHQP